MRCSMPVRAEKSNGDIVRVIGEGNEDGDRVLEMLDVMHALYECVREADRIGKSVQVSISLIPAD